MKATIVITTNRDDYFLGTTSDTDLIQRILSLYPRVTSLSKQQYEAVKTHCHELRSENHIFVELRHTEHTAAMTFLQLLIDCSFPTERDIASLYHRAHVDPTSFSNMMKDFQWIDDNVRYNGSIDQFRRMARGLVVSRLHYTMHNGDRVLDLAGFWDKFDAMCQKIERKYTWKLQSQGAHWSRTNGARAELYWDTLLYVMWLTADDFHVYHPYGFARFMQGPVRISHDACLRESLDDMSSNWDEVNWPKEYFSLTSEHKYTSKMWDSFERRCGESDRKE